MCVIDIITKYIALPIKNNGNLELNFQGTLQLLCISNYINATVGIVDILHINRRTLFKCNYILHNTMLYAISISKYL